MKTLVVKNNRVRAIFLAGEPLRINEGYTVSVADGFAVAVGDFYAYAEPVDPSPLPAPDPSRLVVVSSVDPVNADGRPDGTVWIKA